MTDQDRDPSSANPAAEPTSAGEPPRGGASPPQQSGAKPAAAAAGGAPSSGKAEPAVKPVVEEGKKLNHVDPRADLPTLYRDRSFQGMAVTQFLGAFNDNLFKQLMLLLAIPVGVAATQDASRDAQGVAQMVFALPFILFSGFAGYLSDRFSKRRIIVLSKVAEIGVMLLGMSAFALYGVTGYTGLLVVLFFMGTQSAFFGPGKYGILPEMLRRSDLPRANGVILMLTFLAIILGTASAGVLGEVFVERPDEPTQVANQILLSRGFFIGGMNTTPSEVVATTASSLSLIEPESYDPSRLWIGSIICVGIAVAGTATSLLIRRLPAARPELKLDYGSLAVAADTRRLLKADFPLLMALVASCVFWLVGGVAMQAVNSLGMVQLKAGMGWTSLLTASIGLGIAAGAVIAGRCSHGRADFRLVRIGLWGMVAFLLVLSVSRPGGVHLLGSVGSMPALVLLGVSAGLFAIPLQVFLQARPPEGQKGRMIAAMNFFNFIAILLSGAIYTLFDWFVSWIDAPRSVLFALTALLLLPVAFWYRPSHDEPNGADPAETTPAETAAEEAS